MALIKLGWNRLTTSEKLLKGEYIVQQMTANAAVFPTPNPALADVTTARDNLGAAAVAAEGGGYALTFAKNEAEKVYDGLIAQLAAYVQNISAGDASIILQAGMQVRKTPSPVPPPEQVENLSAVPTLTAGQIQLNWDTLGRNYVYQVEQFVPDSGGDGIWNKIGLPSKSKFTVENLTTGTVYRFRVAGVGKDDEIGPFSQDASSVAP